MRAIETRIQAMLDGDYAWRRTPDGRTNARCSPVIENQLTSAVVRAGQSESRIGAAVVRSVPTEAAHRWDCLATDRHEWHYLRVLGVDLGPFPNLSPHRIEEGIERFAGTLPAAYRITHLLNANPLHVDGSGSVSD